MNIPLGPVMPQEGNVLSSLITMLEPKVIVEFGCQTGASTKIMHDSPPYTQWIYTYDPFVEPQEWMTDSRVFFLKKGQETFESADINHQKIDLVFFDGSHNLKLNIDTWHRFKASLAPGAIIAVHDTGMWDTRLFTAPGFGKIVGHFQVHQPDEVAFVNWLRSVEGLEGIDLCPTHVVRHGLTLLQRSKDEDSSDR